MKVTRAFILMSVALTSVLIAPVSASAQAGKKRGRVPNRAKAYKEKKKPSSAIDQAQAELDLYSMGPDEFSELETQEIIALAQHLYEPDAQELSAVSAEITRIQNERWGNKEGIEAYQNLLSERSRLHRELMANIDSAATARNKLRQLRKNKEFAKVLSDLRRYERRKPHQFKDFAEKIESVLAPTRVETAKRHWKSRISESRRTIRISGLLRGLRNRRWPKPDSEKPSGGERSQAKSGNRTGPERPRSAPRAPKPSSVAKKKSATSGSARTTGPARPLSEWEAYVRDFILKYELTQSQTNASFSILRDIQSRARLIEKSNRDKIAAAQKITDSKRRKQRLDEINKPTDRLFRELQRRLEGLLTASQRSKFSKA